MERGSIFRWWLRVSGRAGGRGESQPFARWGTGRKAHASGFGTRGRESLLGRQFHGIDLNA